MSKELGGTLKQFRTRCELTQQQVADILHIDRSTYAYYERGTTEPELKSIIRLSKVFKVPVECLLPSNDEGMNRSLSDVNKNSVKGVFEEKNTFDDLKDEKIYSLSKEERGFVAWMRALTPEQKAKLRSAFEEVDE